MKKAKLQPGAIAALLAKFETHLTCRETKRSIGSIVDFQMGRDWRYRLRSGDTVPIGSAGLVLEGDAWVIEHRGLPIADSVSLADADMEKLSRAFFGKKLLSLAFDGASKQCRIGFADDFHIKLRDGSAGDDLCTLTFPDGTIIGCDGHSGFNSDGSRDETRAAAYALEPSA